MGTVIAAGTRPLSPSESTKQRKGREPASPCLVEALPHLQYRCRCKIIESIGVFCIIQSHKMETAFKHLALPLLQVRARRKRGLKHLQLRRFLPAQDNISSSPSKFMSRHAQDCCDPSSLVESSHLKPIGILQAVKERLFSQDGQFQWNILNKPNAHQQDQSPYTMHSQLLSFKLDQVGEVLSGWVVWF